MPRVPPTTYEDATPAVRERWDGVVTRAGRMTTLQRTLARAPAALDAALTVQQLRGRVELFLGGRGTTLLSLAVAEEQQCPASVAYCARLLADAGEDLGNLALTGRDALVTRFGRAMARTSARVDEDTFRRLRQAFNEVQLVELTAFCAQLVATNAVCNALEVEPEAELGNGQGANLTAIASSNRLNF